MNGEDAAVKADRGNFLRNAYRDTTAACGECLSKKLASPGFGRRAAPAKNAGSSKTESGILTILLLAIAQLPRATFYCHLKQMGTPDEYKTAKAKITVIYHENRGRYGCRRITAKLHSRCFSSNHETVQRIMKELGLPYQDDEISLLQQQLSGELYNGTLQAGTGGLS